MVRHVRPSALLVFGLTMAFLPVGVRADGDEDRRDGSCSHERALRIAHNYADAWNSHDPDVIVTYFTKTVFYQDVPGEAQAPGQFTHSWERSAYGRLPVRFLEDFPISTSRLLRQKSPLCYVAIAEPSSGYFPGRINKLTRCFLCTVLAR